MYRRVGVQLRRRSNKKLSLAYTSRKAIIIFIKNPEKGKVKTRLAKDIGEEEALNIYLSLLKKTRDVTNKADADKFIFYSNYIDGQDDWDSNAYHKLLQRGLDLGERMYHAFKSIFSKNYFKAIIIGSDCPQLSVEILNEAFNKLDSRDFVLGPAKDGGYYLLGMKKIEPEIFQNKSWSTSTVLEDTITDIGNMNKTYWLLQELSDIDTADDLKKFPSF